MNVPFCFILVLFGGLAVAQSTLDKKSSQLENGGKDVLVGDIKYTPEQFKNRFGNETMRSRTRRAALGNVPWTSKFIYYSFYPPIQDQQIKNKVFRAMTEWECHTCIRFMYESDTSKSPLLFINDRSGKCSASYGKDKKYPLSLYLAANCMDHKSLLHELGHAIGLTDEQNRNDRDYYLTINWQNIKSGYEDKFKKNAASQPAKLPQGTVYDPYSIMHEDDSRYSASGAPVFTAKNSTMQKLMGTAKRLSFKDFKAINAIFQCKGTNCLLNDADCPDGGYVDKWCGCVCMDGNDPWSVVPCA